MGGLTFKPELAEAVMAGTKTQTRRRLSDNPNSPWWREECGFKVGRHYAVQPGRGKKQIGRALILDTFKQRLDSMMNDAMAQREGVATLAEFKSVWVELHDAFDPDEVVWVVVLQRRLRYRVFIPWAPNYPRTYPAESLEDVAALLGRYRRGHAIDNETGERLAPSDLRQQGR